jgi:uncharacterized membrane protein
MSSIPPSRAYRPSSLPYSASVQSTKLRHHPLLKDFQHKNINLEHQDQLSFGDRLADSIANGIGSWGFIIIQAILMALWFIANTIEFFIHFDPYPFIFLNLAMSAEAAFSAPIIMMSQNRQAEKDRLKADQDYLINVKSEHEVMLTLERIEKQEQLILQLIDKIEDQEKREMELLKKINTLLTMAGKYED